MVCISQRNMSEPSKVLKSQLLRHQRPLRNKSYCTKTGQIKLLQESQDFPTLIKPKDFKISLLTSKKGREPLSLSPNTAPWSALC